MRSVVKGRLRKVECVCLSDVEIMFSPVLTDGGFEDILNGRLECSN